MAGVPKQADAPSSVRVQRFWRPEDLGRDAGYRGGFWDVYAAADGEAADVAVEDVLRKCSVLPAGSTGGAGPMLGYLQGFKRGFRT